MMRRVFAVLGFACLLLLAGGCSAQKPAASETGHDWPEYGGGKSHQRYSAANQINENTVGQLDVAWIWETPDTAIDDLRLTDASGTPVTSSAFKTTPIVIDGRMYVRSSYSMVSAVDPETGTTEWTFDPKAYEAPLPGNFGHSARGLSHWGEGQDARLITVSTDGRLFALAPETGTPLGSFGTDGEVDVTGHVRMPDGTPAVPGQYAFYTPPLVCGDTIVLGFAVPRLRPEYDPAKGHAVPYWTRGDVLAFSARTGGFMWRLETTPFDPSGRISGGKANVWSSMSCDEELGLAYLPVAGASENFIGVHRAGNGDYSQSVVAVDPASGAVRWHYKTIRHGLWDYDLVSGPSLIDLDTDAGPVRALVQLNKTGFLYVLDRETGQPVWPIPDVAVPASQIPGEVTAPTQPMPARPRPVDVQAPLTEDDLVDLSPRLAANAERVLAEIGGQRLFTPIGEGPTLLLPGVGGGPNWGGAAFDPDSQMLFVPSQTNPFLFSIGRIEPDTPEYARSTLGLQLRVENRLFGGMPVTRPPYSRVTAIDMRTGEHAWVSANGAGFNQHPAFAGLEDLPPLGSNGISGILATPELVFSADSGAYNNRGGGRSRIRAFRKSDGELLWEAPLPAEYSGAAPITYHVNGNQYLVIAVGGDAAPGSAAPSYLVAYSLSGSGATAPGTARRDNDTETASLTGEEVYATNGCNACHGPQGRPLNGLDQYSDEELAALIREPASDMMPAFDLSRHDMTALIAYLREHE